MQDSGHSAPPSEDPIDLYRARWDNPGHVQRPVRDDLTRVSDGATFNINSNGPGTITIPAGADFPSTIAARGQTSYFTPTGGWQYTGLVMIDPMTGNVISHTGNVTDLCLLFQ